MQINDHYYRLCYSLHSSYSEICTFVRQIAPKRVYPIALPTRVTPQYCDELLIQLGISQSSSVGASASSSSAPQIKRRYEPIESKSGESELEFDCH